MDHEIWKDIKDYEGLYKVSNLGRVKSLKRRIELKSKNQFTYFTVFKEIEGKEIKPSINYKGYCQLSLYKNGKSKNKQVHRLVAEAFLENPQKKPTVNHINGNKIDNRVENLEYATNKEQIEHSIKVLNHKSVISEKCRKRQIELHQRKVIRADGLIFNSIKEASNGNETLRKHINMCCKGKRATAGGYGWTYYG